jgi:hypothetical protein
MLLQYLQQLTAYCDQYTSIGIGSCYGGATFTFPGNGIAPAGRMNGDSLMMGIGKIFYQQPYLCQSKLGNE